MRVKLVFQSVRLSYIHHSSNIKDKENNRFILEDSKTAYFNI